MDYNSAINLTENEYNILRIMMYEECLDYFNSIDLKTLSEKVELSNVYIRQVLNKLIKLSLIEEGMKKGRAFTYFVTPSGYECVISIIARSSNKEIENMKEEIKFIKGSGEDELNEK